MPYFLARFCSGHFKIFKACYELLLARPGGINEGVRVVWEWDVWSVKLRGQYLGLCVSCLMASLACCSQLFLAVKPKHSALLTSTFPDHMLIINNKPPPMIHDMLKEAFCGPLPTCIIITSWVSPAVLIKFLYRVRSWTDHLCSCEYILGLVLFLALSKSGPRCPHSAGIPGYCQQNVSARAQGWRRAAPGSHCSDCCYPRIVHFWQDPQHLRKR